MSADCTSTVINSSAEHVFSFMAAPENMDLWSFGTWSTDIQDDGLIKGEALHDGSIAYVRIETDKKRYLIDYHLGTQPENLQPRIFARVVPGTVIGNAAENCLLLLVAMRTSEMQDRRWQNLVNVHKVEIELIRSLIESSHDHRRTLR